MRMHVNSRSTIFIKKSGGQSAPVDMQELRAALDDDAPKSRALLNEVARYSGSLHGTTAFRGGRQTSSKPTFMA
jgi:hypothetical protein